MSELPALRKQIDAIDERILELLEKRARIAQEIGQEKRRTIEAQRSKAAPTVSFYDPEREAAILSRLETEAAKAKSLFPRSSIRYVFREIISACRSLELPMKIAFLGPEGTYTQIASGRFFGNSVEYLPMATIGDVFHAVERGQARYGVVPLENSAEGGVAQTLDALIETPLRIRSEIVLSISHCLLSRSENPKAIRKVYSHPQAISQSKRWLSENLAHAEVIAAKSTAAAAHAAAQDPSAAAIGSRQVAEILGLRILKEGIQDQVDNATRFVVLSETDGIRTGADRTSILFKLKEGPDALLALLQLLKRQRIAISRIESRADSLHPWEFLYFLDFLGHRQDPKVKPVLKKIQSQCKSFKLLGSYPTEAGLNHKEELVQ